MKDNQIKKEEGESFLFAGDLILNVGILKVSILQLKLIKFLVKDKNKYKN
jgi:hypothetical protein